MGYEHNVKCDRCGGTEQGTARPMGWTEIIQEGLLGSSTSRLLFCSDRCHDFYCVERLENRPQANDADAGLTLR